jgi:serine/threonine protein kinase
MSLISGTRLGRYEIRSKLGEGGMGEVYRARDEKLNRDVAIKVLPAELSQNVDRLNRFEQEAQAAGALNHPNILSVYDVGLHEGAPYIVAELLEGEELREALAGGALTSRKAVDYAQQIADGLAAAHDKGIVHRDLKPENIFVCKDGRVKILDFGLAKLRAPQGDVVSSEVATRKQITDPGTVMGTAGYMSPEQVRGHAIDHRSDIFSFGAVLYEMLCGKHAFRRETIAETMTAILKEDPPEVSTINPTINLPLERIVRRCLEKQPERRFQTASDLAFALESLSGSTQSVGSMRAATSSAYERRPWP